MSLPDRRKVLTLLTALPLAGCGFTPVYAPLGTGNKLRYRVEIEAPRSRSDFAFVSQLETRFGQPKNAIYHLGYSLKINRASGGISPSNEITHYTLTGIATYTLTERATKTRVAGGVIRNFTSWSATGSTVAGIAAEEAASARLMQILADDIVTRLMGELS